MSLSAEERITRSHIEILPPDTVVPINAHKTEITDTDLANGRRLAKLFGCDFRYTAEHGFYTYDGRRWAHDLKYVEMSRLAKRTAESIFDELKTLPSIQRDALFKHAKASQSKRALEAMVWCARSEPGVLATLADFDRDPWLFNAANETVDLRTGKGRPHDRRDLLSKISSVTFDSGATCPRFQEFLKRITDGDPDLYGYLWRLVGYLLTGLTIEQVLHFFLGAGANGKSVFCELMLQMLGEYALVASSDLILARRHTGIPNDVARLVGMRAVFMNETSQGSRFDEAKLKDLTGGDKLTGRFMREEFFDFRPEFKLLIRGNHKPAINGTDEGIWRRLRLVPFNVSIPPEQRDRMLLQRLEAELPGVLRWAVDGCLRWQSEGLNPPVLITDAVRAYREESDTLGRFISESCDERKLGQVRSGLFFQRYQQFSELQGERWIPSKDLPREMERRGFQYKRGTGGVRLYLGIEFNQREVAWNDE